MAPVSARVLHHSNRATRCLSPSVRACWVARPAHRRARSEAPVRSAAFARHAARCTRHARCHARGRSGRTGVPSPFHSRIARLYRFASIHRSARHARTPELDAVSARRRAWTDAESPLISTRRTDGRSAVASRSIRRARRSWANLGVRAWAAAYSARAKPAYPPTACASASAT
jgi:hypothetical protein